MRNTLDQLDLSIPRTPTLCASHDGHTVAASGHAAKILESKPVSLVNQHLMPVAGTFKNITTISLLAARDRWAAPGMREISATIGDAVATPLLVALGSSAAKPEDPGGLPPKSPLIIFGGGSLQRNRTRGRIMPGAITGQTSFGA